MRATADTSDTGDHGDPHPHEVMANFLNLLKHHPTFAPWMSLANKIAKIMNSFSGQVDTLQYALSPNIVNVIVHVLY